MPRFSGESEQRPATPPEIGVSHPGAIAGRVLTREGVFAAEATVEFRQFRGRLPAGVDGADDLRTILTDTDGRFFYPNLPIGTYLFVVRYEDAGGYGEATLSYKRPFAEVEIVIGPGGPVAGRVENTVGNPIEGAAVRAVAHDRFAVEQDLALKLSVITDAKGAFSLPFLPHHEWQFVAEAQNYSPARTDHVPAGSLDLLLIMEPGARLSGRVVDSQTGLGIGGMTLAGRQGGVPIDLETRTDDSGAFAFSGLTPGAIELIGTHPDYALVETPTVAFASTLAKSEIVVEASTGAAVQGRVLSREGTGIPGIRVGMDSVVTGMIETTDQGGYFYFSNVPPGSYSVRTRAAPLDERSIQVAQGEIIEVADWIVDVGMLEGEVVDVSGKSVCGALVLVTAGTLIADGRSGADGRFLISGPDISGDLTVTASTLEYSSAPERVRVGTGETPFVRLTLERYRGVIAGRVVDSLGRPKPASVTISSHPGALPRPTPTVSGTRIGPPELDDIVTEDLTGPATDIAVATDKDGYFLATVDTPSKYYVYLYTFSPNATVSKDVLAEEFLLRDGESRTDLRLVFPDSGTSRIRGRVTENDGTPASGHSVTALGSDFQDVSQATTNIDGEFILQDLKEVRYRVSVRAQGFMTTRKADVRAGTENLVLVLRKPPVVTGTVVDASNGRPIEKFEAGFTQSRYKTNLHTDFRQVSHALGGFSLPAPEVAEFEALDLIIQAAGFASSRVPLGEVHGDIGPVDVTLQPSATQVSGRVMDDGGNPVVGARISAWTFGEGALSGPANTALSGSDGAFLLNGLAFGTEMLEVKHPDFASMRHPVAPQGDHELLIVLLSGVTLEGVLTMDGTPVEGARVSVTAPDGEAQYTDGAGRFQFRRVAPGDLSIQARTVNSAGEIGRHSFSVSVPSDSDGYIELNVNSEEREALDGAQEWMGSEEPKYEYRAISSGQPDGFENHRVNKKRRR